MKIGEKLSALADRDRGRGLDDPDALRAHYALLGIDAGELVVAVAAYLRVPPRAAARRRPDNRESRGSHV